MKEEINMMKNKAIKALIIGTCLMASSVAGVYADTDNVEVKPAIIEQATDDSKMMEVQILSAIGDDALTQKQKEIDEYVFEKHAKDFEEKGITITHTAVMGEFVEVGIAPYDAKSAEYLYEIFGKDKMMVAAGEQAVPLENVIFTANNVAEEQTSFFGKILNGIAEWFKSIF
jgi:hypothetical protein